MKHLIIFFVLIILSWFNSFNADAQAPHFMSYQAVLRNANDALVTNQLVSVKVSILQGSATGTEVYAETHGIVSNPNGLITLQIGNGTSIGLNLFSSIDWSAGPYFIKLGTDLNGGSNYSITSTTQLLSVPYALYAAKSGNGMISGNSNGNTLRWDGTNWIADQSVFNDGNNVGVGTNAPGAKLDIAGQVKIQGGNPGVGKLLSSDASGLASWKTITANDINAWSTNGNAGTGSANFIGTTDNQDLRFKVNNISAGLLQSNGTTFLGLNAGLSNTSGITNTAIGSSALRSNTSGDFNTAIGANALYTNSGGSNNVAMGRFAAYSNSTGHSITSTGSESMYSNTTGNNNTASGFRSLRSNTIGSGNVAMGDSSLASNIVGSNNTAIGSKAMANVADAINNTAVGSNSLYSNASGNDNNAFGREALNSNTSGNSNVAVGFRSMRFNTMGYSNSSIGNYSLYNNISGNFNSASGFYSLFSNTHGDLNTSSGAYSLRDNTTGERNTSVGAYSLYNNTTGSSNTSMGSRALYTNTTGRSNIAIGANSLYASTIANHMIAIGDSALYATTSTFPNVAVGGLALNANTSGGYNNAVGYYALKGNTTGDYNLAMGSLSLRMNTTGDGNTAVGHSSLNESVSGSNNTAVGASTMSNNSSGGYNTAIGYFTMNTMESGTYCTAIGSGSDVNAAGRFNATAIGASSTVNANNKVRIGGSTITVIEGQVAYSFPSDARFKKSVQENVPGLDFIKRLKPVTYTFDTKKFDEHLMQEMTDSDRKNKMKDINYTPSSAIVHTGFLAQDIERICMELKYDFDGLHIPDPEDKTDNYSVAYSQFIMPLVKAVQEQQVQIEELKASNKLLQEQYNRITETQSSGTK
jgi:hypothetical protein